MKKLYTRKLHKYQIREECIENFDKMDHNEFILFANVYWEHWEFRSRKLRSF